MNRLTPQTDDTFCSDALWLAVQYLGGELSAAESSAFEDRLADDPVACEALSQAVILSESVRSSGVCASVRGVDVRLNRRSKAAWFRSVALLSVAAVLLLVGWFAGHRRADERAAAGSPVSQGLVTVGPEGEESRRSLPATSHSTDSEVDSMLSVWLELSAARDLSGDGALVEGIDGAADADSAAGESEVPDWMFAALLVPGESDELMSPAVGPDREESL